MATKKGSTRRQPAGGSTMPPDDFVQLSVVLTGYEASALWGTGQVDSYREVVKGAVGAKNLNDLLLRARAIHKRHGHDIAATEEAYRVEILSSPRLGPIARNVIQLWYLGTWMGMPAQWKTSYGSFAGDTNRVVSAAAYQESLVYQAARAHPPGARQPGYGSWALNPVAKEQA